MDGITIIAALFGLFVYLVLRLITGAPIGYQNCSGFHYGKPSPGDKTVE